MSPDASATFADPVPPPDTSAGDQAGVVADPPRRIGRYHILGELGRGGLGVVYRGFDPELKREAAVKLLISGRWAGGPVRDRFRAEAEAVARLSHPNIVGVYEVGEVDDRPYLALELVDGPTLAVHLTAGPLAPAAAARLIATLADAIAHAHQQGVVHRDLKPGNVMLAGVGADRAGEASEGSTLAAHSSPLVPRVVDFGLAKLTDDADRLTRTGVVIGTPSYMAPEQAAAGPGAADPAVDVYALGAMLYECLTGRPPFQAATVFDALDLVRSADPVPPRRLQPRIPRDLEVICLHCLEKAPGRRYPSAEALFDDLRRFLDGRAITARPVGVSGRAARWTRRNPAAAGLVGLAVAAAAAAVGGVAWHNVQLQRALGEVTVKEEEARAARDQANTNYRNAQDAIRRILGRLDGQEYVGVPRLSELRRRQQEDALAFVLAVAARGGDSPEVQYDTAQAQNLAGQYLYALGREADGERHFRAAVEGFAGLARRFPDDPQFRRSWAASLLRLWPYHDKAGDVAGAERVVRQVIGLREQLAAADPASTYDRSELAQAQANLGNLFAGHHRYADAVPPYRTAAGLDRAVLATDPGNLEFKERLASTLSNLSMVLRQQPDGLAEAEPYHAESIRLYDEVVRGNPADLSALYGLALARVNWVYVRFARKQYDQALADLTDNLRAVEPVWQREPTHTLLREAMYRTYGATANLHDARKDRPAAAAAWRKVVDLSPADERPVNRMLLALALARAGDHAAAVAEAEAVAAEPPPVTSPDHWVHLATVATVARSNGPADASDRYARLAARMLTRAKAATDPGKWAVTVLKLMFDPDLAPAFTHPEVRAAAGLPGGK